jgi:hypothetical protein
MSIELMLNSVNLTLVAYNRVHTEPHTGQIFTFFATVVHAAEAAVGLAIVSAFFRVRKTVRPDEADLLRNQRGRSSASTGSPLASLPPNQFPRRASPSRSPCCRCLRRSPQRVSGKRLGKGGRPRFMALPAVRRLRSRQPAHVPMSLSGAGAEEGGWLAWNAWHWFSITGR